MYKASLTANLWTCLTVIYGKRASDGNQEQLHPNQFGTLGDEEYKRLREDAEMLQDIQDFDEAKLAIANGEELIPSEVTYALLDGENPLRVWRKYRGLTQQQVAKAASISKPYLSQLESGQRKGTTEVLQAIARVFNVSLDDLVRSDVEE